MARKKEEAVAEKQAAQDGNNAVRCQRGRKRLEVKEATVSTEYENQNNSMKEMSRGGGSIKENNNNNNIIIKKCVGGDSPPVQRERTALWNSKGIVLTPSKGKINNSLGCHKNTHTHTHTYKIVLFFFCVTENANLPASLGIAFICCCRCTYPCKNCQEASRAKRILTNLNSVQCLYSLSQHSKWVKEEKIECGGKKKNKRDNVCTEGRQK